MSRATASASAGILLASALCAMNAGCSAGGIDVIDVDPDQLVDGLLAHWSFDDGVGDRLTDLSGYDRHGTIKNGTWIAGHPGFGGALHFDATGEVSVPSFPQPTGSWTVAGWIRPPAGDFDFGDTYLTLISTELLTQGGWEMNARLTPNSPTSPGGTIYQFAYWIGPNVPDYFYYDCSCVVRGEWTHLAAVVDPPADTLSFYVNGALKDETPPPAGGRFPPVNPGSPTLYLARWPPNPVGDPPPARMQRELSGDLDDFVVYGRALPSREIEHLFRVGVPKGH